MTNHSPDPRTDLFCIIGNYKIDRHGVRSLHQLSAGRVGRLKRLFEYPLIIALFRRAGIALMGEIIECEFDNPGTIARFDANRAQGRWNAEILVQPGNRVAEIGIRREAHGETQALIFLRRGAVIEAQQMRQEDRVQRAMMQFLFLQATRRVAERMDRTEALGESQRAFIARHHHVPARILVRAIVDGPLQGTGLDGAVETVIADAFRRRIDGRGQHRLDTMGHCVHAGRGGEQRRQTGHCSWL